MILSRGKHAPQLHTALGHLAVQSIVNAIVTIKHVAFLQFHALAQLECVFLDHNLVCSGAADDGKNGFIRKANGVPFNNQGFPHGRPIFVDDF